VHLAVFKVILEYLYKETVDIPPAIAIDILIKANEWGLNKLKQLCEIEIVKCIDRDNVINIILVSETHEADYLLAECINVLFIHFTSLHTHENFKHISASVLTKLDAVRAAYELASTITIIKYKLPVDIK